MAKKFFFALQLVKFSTPPETIAFGLEKAEYKSPLKVGDTYRYGFEFASIRLYRGKWRVDCRITCTALEPQPRTVAVWVWKPGFVEHPELGAETLHLLQPKPYRENVMQYVCKQTLHNLLSRYIMAPAETALKAAPKAAAICVLAFLLACIMPSSTAQMMDTFCQPDLPCYVGMTP